MKIPLQVLELSENLRTQLMVFEIDNYSESKNDFEISFISSP